jgi:hypothetical protein
LGEVTPKQTAARATATSDPFGDDNKKGKCTIKKAKATTKKRNAGSLHFAVHDEL